MENERRSFAREAVIVEIEPKGQYPGKTFRLLNISLSGFKLETNYFLEVGQHFDFTFSLPEGEDLWRLAATVVWTDQLPSKPEHYHIGLKFPKPLKKLPNLFSLPLTEQERASLS